LVLAVIISYLFHAHRFSYLQAKLRQIAAIDVWQFNKTQSGRDGFKRSSEHLLSRILECSADGVGVSSGGVHGSREESHDKKDTQAYNIKLAKQIAYKKALRQGGNAKGVGARTTGGPRSRFNMSHSMTAKLLSQDNYGLPEEEDDEDEDEENMAAGATGRKRKRQ
jgi:hypothetical protein